MHHFVAILALRCALILVCCASLAVCQVSVEEDIVTDSVDIGAALAAQKPKQTNYMYASLLLPGLGQELQGRHARAVTFLRTEAACIFTLVLFEMQSHMVMNNAKSYAFTYAHAQGGQGADDAFWLMVGQYDDVTAYNSVLELNRDPDIGKNKYVADNLLWRWDDTSQRKKFERMRKDAADFHLIATFAIAGMVANRVVSFIDARMSMRDNRISIAPTYSTQRGNGMVVNVSF